MRNEQCEGFCGYSHLSCSVQDQVERKNVGETAAKYQDHDLMHIVHVTTSHSVSMRFPVVPYLALPDYLSTPVQPLD